MPSGRTLEKVLSIRVAADGLSFSCAMDNDAVPKGFFEAERGWTVTDVLRHLIQAEKLSFDNFQSTQLEMDTNRLVLVPNSIFEPGSEGGYLAVNNIFYGEHEQVVVSPAFGIRAVMVAPRDFVEYVAMHSADVRFTSPILESIYRKKRGTVELNLTRHNAYISVIEDKLDYAEAVPCESMADILYYMKRLGGRFDLQNCTILVIGHNAEEVVKRLGRYYRSVIGNAHYQW